MRILHATKKYNGIIGGDAIVVDSLRQEQEKQGHDIFVLTSRCAQIQYEPQVLAYGITENQYLLDQITYKRIISLGILVFYAFYLLKKIKPDVIHSHSEDIGFALSFAARVYRIPMINTLHALTFSDKQHSPLKRAIEYFLLVAAHFYTITSPDPLSTKEFAAYKIRNFVFVPNGVFLPTKRAQKIVNNQLIFVGRLEKQKGLSYLIEACHQLATEKINFGLTVIGDGSEMSAIKSLVSQYKLGKNIHFLGKLNHDRVASFLKKSSIFVLPSLWEGFPLSILEAWSEKCAVVATDVNGVALLCTNNFNSLVIKSLDASALYQAIKKLLTSTKLVKKLGDNGYKTVEKYQWSNIAAQYYSLYTAALAHN